MTEDRESLMERVLLYDVRLEYLDKKTCSDYRVKSSLYNLWKTHFASAVCVCVCETKATKGQSANSSLWSVTITDTAVIQTVTPADGHFTRC